MTFKQSFPLKATTDDKVAEYYIHKMLVVPYEGTPYIIAFSEDQKVKVYEANTFKQIQDIKFSSSYGQMACKCDFKIGEFDPECNRHMEEELNPSRKAEEPKVEVCM